MGRLEREPHGAIPLVQQQEISGALPLPSHPPVGGVVSRDSGILAVEVMGKGQEVVFILTVIFQITPLVLDLSSWN